MRDWRLGIAILAASFVTASVDAGGLQVGDVNCDVHVDSIDAALILQHNAGLISDLPCLAQADVNVDGGVTAVDATLVLQYVAGILGELPPPSATLEIHHIDVEQGDAALIIAPNGGTAMVDDGRWTNCGNTIAYLEGLSIESIDYHFATHYDADHIGCLDDMAEAGITVGACYDRGTTHEPDTATYQAYAETCSGTRHTLSRGQLISLEGAVTMTVVDLNGAGVSTSDENALGVVLRLSFGHFDEVFAGDLPGESPDIESVVGPEVGDVDVAMVNHHGSRFSSTDAWLDAVSPEIAVLSVGNNSYGHPTSDALGRLHAHGVHVYWTNTGSGAAPDPAWDLVGGNVVIEARSGSYTVSGDSFSVRYTTD